MLSFKRTLVGMLAIALLGLPMTPRSVSCPGGYQDLSGYYHKHYEQQARALPARYSYPSGIGSRLADGQDCFARPGAIGGGRYARHARL